MPRGDSAGQASSKQAHTKSKQAKSSSLSIKACERRRADLGMRIFPSPLPNQWALSVTLRVLRWPASRCVRYFRADRLGASRRSSSQPSRCRPSPASSKQARHYPRVASSGAARQRPRAQRMNPPSLQPWTSHPCACCPGRGCQRRGRAFCGLPSCAAADCVCEAATSSV